VESGDLVLLVLELSKRIDALEGVGYKFWVPIVVSIVAVLVSAFSIHMNRNQSKISGLQAIKGNINLAKAQIETLSMELAPLKAKKNQTADEKRELELKLQVYDSAIERLLNGYNDGCDRFFKGQDHKKHYMDIYHQDIRDYVEKIPDKFQGPLTRFDHMLKYYNDKHKQAKA
jgi:hypothetical protein